MLKLSAIRNGNVNNPFALMVEEGAKRLPCLIIILIVLVKNLHKLRRKMCLFPCIYFLQRVSLKVTGTREDKLFVLVCWVVFDGWVQAHMHFIGVFMFMLLLVEKKLTLLGWGSAFGFTIWVPGGIIPLGGSLTSTSIPASIQKDNLQCMGTL